MLREVENRPVWVICGDMILFRLEMKVRFCFDASSARRDVSRLLSHTRGRCPCFFRGTTAFQAVRCQVLDYFFRQREGLRDDHVLFSFEQSMVFSKAEFNLIDQACFLISWSSPGKR